MCVNQGQQAPPCAVVPLPGVDRPDAVDVAIAVAVLRDIAADPDASEAARIEACTRLLEFGLALTEDAP